MELLKKYINYILVVVVIVAGGLAYYYFGQYQDLKANPQKVAQQETKDLVAAVSKLMVLPEGEDPTIATVADPDKLKDQAFFAKAQKGDKVLIYANAKKAILYNPGSNRIVEIAPLNIGNQAPAK